MIKRLYLLLFFTLLLVSSVVFAEPLERGSRIGQYSVIRLLGKGSMAEVYLVQAPDKKRYALKYFYPKSVDEALREQSIAKSLNSQDIVKMYDSGSSYIVMQYIEGDTINRVKKGSLTKKETLKAIDTLVQSIGYALSQGYIHTDLWPKNFFIDKKKQLKVIDLGSFELLPEDRSLGQYCVYVIALKNVIGDLIELGDFSSSEKQELLDAIDEVQQRSSDYELLVQNRAVIQAAIESIWTQIYTQTT